MQSLLPVRVPSSDNFMDILSSRRQLFGDHYKEALKFLKLTLQSPPPISEAALLPSVQVLYCLIFRLKKCVEFVYDNLNSLSTFLESSIQYLSSSLVKLDNYVSQQ